MLDFNSKLSNVIVQKWAIITLFIFLWGNISFSQSVTVTTFPTASQFLARDVATNLATVKMTGTVLLSSNYTQIGYKISKNGVAVQSEFFPLVFNGTTAPFNIEAKLNAELSYYTIELYAKGTTEVLIKSATKLLVGDAYIVGGQSNAVFGVNVANESEFVKITGVSNGWAPRAAKNIVTNQKIPVALFGNGVSGTPLSYHVGTANYTTLLNQVKAAGLDKKILGAFWFQGESDAIANSSVDAYKTLFETLLSDWERDYAIKKCYIFQIPFNACGSTSTGTLEAQRLLDEVHDNVHTISTSNSTHDGCHYAYAGGYAVFGDRLYDILANHHYNAQKENVESPFVKLAYKASAREINLLCSNVTALNIIGSPLADFSINGAVKPISIKANGNVLTLGFANDVTTATQISYLSHSGTAANWVTNTTNGANMLSFANFPIGNPPASIAGKVFLDANNNNVFDAGETPLPNITILLHNNATGAAITNVFSNAQGDYIFPNLLAGTYKLLYSGTLNNEFVAKNGESLIVTVKELENIKTADIPYIKNTTPAIVGGFTYIDNNKNNIYDTADSTLANVKVTLCNNAGLTLKTTNSLQNGTFSFDNLVPDTYILKFLTTLEDGKAINTANNINITLTPGQNNNNTKVGYIKPITGIVKGLTYNDLNKNNLYDTNETPLANVTVSLYNNLAKLVSTANSDQNGVFVFDKLVTGVYIIKFPEVLADGKTLVNTSPFSLYLTEGQFISSIKAGYLGNTPVVVDTDGDGFADNIDACPSVKGVAPNGCPATVATGCASITTTASNGQIIISGLTSTPFIQIFTSTWGTTSFISGNRTPVNGQVTIPMANGAYIVKVGAFQGQWCDVRFDLSVTNTGGGTTIVDTDGDGIADNVDACPTVKGIAPNGCPATVATGCSAITATASNGQIIISGLSSTPFIQIFTSTWGPTSFVSGNRTPVNGQVTIPMANGAYIVKVGAFQGQWCDVRFDLSETNTGGGTTIVDTDGDGFADNLDACPSVKGVAPNGCPATVATGCSAITATASNGQIVISGLTTAQAFIQLFTSNWGATSFVNSDKTVVNGQIIIPMPAGQYILKVGAFQGQWCDVRFDLTLSSRTSSISDNEKEIRVFPNPASQVLNVDVAAFENSEVNLMIYNLVGQPVKSIKLNNISAEPLNVDISTLSAGTYFLSISTVKGHFANKKFIIADE